MFSPVSDIVQHHFIVYIKIMRISFLQENPLIEYPSSPVEGHLPKRMSIRLAQVLNDLAIAVSDLVFNDGNNLILEVREGYSVASSTDNPSLFHEGRQVDIVLRDKRNGNRLNNNNDVGILAYLAWKNRADWVQHRGWFVDFMIYISPTFQIFAMGM